jgi:hypothetical protein
VTGGTIIGGSNAPGGISLNVTGPSNISGVLNATKGANISGGPFTATSGAAVSGGLLSATSGANISGGILTASGGATISSGATINGMLTANNGATLSSASVTGALDVSNNLNIGNNLIIGGNGSNSIQINARDKSGISQIVSDTAATGIRFYSNTGGKYTLESDSSGKLTTHGDALVKGTLTAETDIYISSKSINKQFNALLTFASYQYPPDFISKFNSGTIKNYTNCADYFCNTWNGGRCNDGWANDRGKYCGYLFPVSYNPGDATDARYS